MLGRVDQLNGMERGTRRVECSFLYGSAIRDILNMHTFFVYLRISRRNNRAIGVSKKGVNEMTKGVKAKATLKEKARRKEYDNRYGRMPRTNLTNPIYSNEGLKPVTGGPVYWCAECRKRTPTRTELIWVEGRGYCAMCAEHKIEHEVWKLRVTSDEDMEQRKIAAPVKIVKSQSETIAEKRKWLERQILC